MRNPDDASRIDAATVALWHDRRDQLNDMLSQYAGAEWNWLWQTRLSVLDYLINRYDHKLNASPSGETKPRGEAMKVRQAAKHPPKESVSPYDHVANLGPAWIDEHNKNLIQTRLDSLRSANSKRLAEAEKKAHEIREAERMSKQQHHPAIARQPAPARERPDWHLQAQALCELDEREYKEMRKFITFDLGLTELQEQTLDEKMIRAILKEHGIEQTERG